MTKHEFEALIQADVSDADYDVIEFVYGRHPSISPDNGKREIAHIYKLPGGMRIIHDMVATAKIYEDLIAKLNFHNRRIEEVRSQIEALKRGELVEI